MIKQYEAWLKGTAHDKILYDELKGIDGNAEAIEDRFFKHLEFGTGGLRGVIGAGTNRMNIYTVRRATMGFANYLNKKAKGGSVVISYDSRNFSKEFAFAAAEVFGAAGIKAYIFTELQPTPLCSYAVRALKASAGVMVTASHNPKIYNGYKAYGADGCQVATEMADGILAEINAIDDYFGVKHEPFEKLLKEGKAEYIAESVYQNYLKEVEKLSVEKRGKKNIKIVYSPLNGTGNKPVRDILRLRGFDDVVVVPEQELPDGNFTTCPFPNPEEKETLKLSTELAKAVNADLVLATDPDCDRVGIAVKDKGEYKLISGNEVGILLTYYLLEQRKQNKTLPDNPILVKTIVSTDLVFEIAKTYNAEVKNVLTGFKFIGGVITGLEAIGQENRYVFGFEESYGYMSGTHVRDKDAVNGSMIIAEMCEHFLTKEKKTLVEVLDELYKKYGYTQSYTKSFDFKGASGLADMNAKLSHLRANPFKTIIGKPVLRIDDYLKGVDGLPKSDVLSYQLDGVKVIIRPSGTEPKLKVYILAKAKSPELLQPIAEAIVPEMTKFFVG